MTIGWVDATGGISGDMLLGACLDAGVDLAVIQDAIDRLSLPEAVVIEAEPARRAGLGATRALVRTAPPHGHRTLDDVLTLLRGLDPEVGERAAAVFRALAAAEATVHDMPVEQVHFHEVGALDSIVDVVGVVAGLQSLNLGRLVCSPIALGGGRVQTDHGPIPVPGPAVIELLRARHAPGFGGPVELELATPTGVALMTALADDFGPLPALRPDRVGSGAGSRDPVGHANVTRLIVGSPDGSDGVEAAVVLETNVDDLDPRLWPLVLAELMSAGASDAWLTPILMKKGRPAHTLSVLAPPQHLERLEQLVFTHTSTIGLRRHAVDKRALARETAVVDVGGEQIRVKIARLHGTIVNVEPEYDDIARVAADQRLPAMNVLAAARAAAERQVGTGA